MILYHLLHILTHKRFSALALIAVASLGAEEANVSLDNKQIAVAASGAVRAGFHDNDDDSQPVAKGFNEEYLLKYFPKAYVIRERFFSQMTFDEVDQALAAIVELLSEKPEKYFVENSEKINVALYWEHILDQCSLMSEFLKKARVNSQDGKVFLPQNLESDPQGRYFGGFGQGQLSKQSPSQSLLLVWRKKNKTAVADFYALCFDYLIKLFNEGFLIKNNKQIDRYYAELEYVFGRMRGTVYESTYQESIKNCKELIALYKTKYRTEEEPLSSTGRSNGI